MLEHGMKAPDFSLKNQRGESISLSQFKGKKIVLYFYPKDDTPGCTKEACNLRDHHQEILERGAVVLGISPDPPESHGKFQEKYQLPFSLLADEEKKVLQLYGAWGEKNMYGKKSQGVLRSTFVIDEAGQIIKVFKKVNTAIHGEEVLSFL